jgi:hypothetical protein
VVRELTRRRALRLGAATAGLGATAGLAGCRAIPFVGGGGYAAWLPAPESISGLADSYRFEWQRTNQIRTNEASFDAEAYERFTNRNETPLDMVDIDFDALNTVLSYQRVIVVRASLDRHVGPGLRLGRRHRTGGSRGAQDRPAGGRERRGTNGDCQRTRSHRHLRRRHGSPGDRRLPGLRALMARRSLAGRLRESKVRAGRHVVHVRYGDGDGERDRLRLPPLG